MQTNFSPKGPAILLDDEHTDLTSGEEDRLTGIGNRGFFERRLDRRLLDAHTNKADVTVLFLDLDRFKLVNDTLGHLIGDYLLRLVSERLRSALSEGDILARFGGDEFAIILTGDSSRTATSSVATRIVDLIQRPFLIEDHVVNVGVSIGIAIGPHDGTAREQLLKRADLALYHSKANGRGNHHFFLPAFEHKAQERRTLEQDLRKALVLRQFELHYRTQINTDQRSIIALEALLRWRHPKRGLLRAEEFLKLAEEIGLAVPIGEWMLKNACKEAIRWPDSVIIAVNISPLHFELSRFAESVNQALIVSGLPGRRLEIEVTEDVLLRDGPAILATLDALRKLQVRVAVDSFGTGMASLSQLVNFPFDKIKLDQSLMKPQEGNLKARAIVRAISALGESLGISTLIEGIETAEHLAHLREEGCNSLEGFYYSEAIPASELMNQLAALFSYPAYSESRGRL